MKRTTIYATLAIAFLGAFSVQGDNISAASAPSEGEHIGDPLALHLWVIRVMEEPRPESGSRGKTGLHESCYRTRALVRYSSVCGRIAHRQRS